MNTWHPRKRGPPQVSSLLAYLLIADVCHLNLMNKFIKFSLSLCVNTVLIPFFWRSLPNTIHRQSAWTMWGWNSITGLPWNKCLCWCRSVVGKKNITTLLESLDFTFSKQNIYFTYVQKWEDYPTRIVHVYLINKVQNLREMK